MISLQSAGKSLSRRSLTTRFHKRVEELKTARYVSDAELFKSAYDLFSDIALIWYRGNKHKATDWNSLTRLLRQEFLPKNYNDILFKQIKERTQHPEEPMVYKKNFILSDASKFYTTKLTPKYVGPYFIHKKLNPWNYELTDSQGTIKGVWNAKDLKPYVDEHPN
ncbi:hypothetical protein RN001_003845 [Aquatica leii]|uniref:Uncharacterized protein n=1 Tax=Aquatica leii TaxID=1421715 RepID=A0AAN7PIX4_9COLE|nr:hypothetical protein RN001_003845 [Aquatica leii]